MPDLTVGNGCVDQCGACIRTFVFGVGCPDPCRFGAEPKERGLGLVGMRKA